MRLKIKTIIIIFWLVKLSLLSFASAIPAMDQGLEQAIKESALPYLTVQVEGLERSMLPYARIELYNIIGRTKIRGQYPVYTIISMIYEKDQWVEAPILPIKQKAIARLFNPEATGFIRVSAQQVLEPEMLGQLEQFSQQHIGQARSINLLINRAMLLTHLKASFRIIPNLDPMSEEWLTPFQSEDMAAGVKEIAEKFNRQILLALQEKEPQLIVTAAQELEQALAKFPDYPPRSKRKLDLFYSSTNPFKFTYAFYLLAGTAFLLFLAYRRKGIYHLSFVFLGLGLILHSGGMAIRYSLTGYAPLSTLYESIIFAIWGLMLIGVILEIIVRNGLSGAVASLLGFLVMVIISFFPLSMTRLIPLQAVLNSAWLTYHVIACMLSYSAFMLSFVFSLTYLTADIFSLKLKWLPQKETLDNLTYRVIQIGWPLLTIGILTGAIWADVAWGRAWSWDPKETWSLITWLIYTIFLHLRLHWGWKGRLSAVASVVGFLSVLMTWFGVSYLPLFSQSLHSYI